MEVERLSKRVKGVGTVYIFRPKILHSLYDRSLFGLMILITQKLNGFRDG